MIVIVLIVKGPSDENQLKITLQDLLMADQQGICTTHT